MKKTRRQSRIKNTLDKGAIQKKYIFVGGILIVLIIALSYLLLTPTKQQKPVINPDARTIYEAPVVYNQDSAKKMLDSVDNRKPLSPNDQDARNTLVAMSNPIHETEEYSIEYVSEPDEFMVEVRSINVGQAKNDAKSWLVKQGLTSEGICKLPVVFYLNADTAEQLRNTNITFDPLPPGC